MKLDLLLVNATLGGQEGQDLGALIALQLNDRSQLLVLDQGAVASEILLEDLEHALLVKVGWQSLDGRQGLASVTLLNTDICLTFQQQSVSQRDHCNIDAINEGRMGGANKINQCNYDNGVYKLYYRQNGKQTKTVCQSPTTVIKSYHHFWFDGEWGVWMCGCAVENVEGCGSQSRRKHVRI